MMNRDITIGSDDIKGLFDRVRTLEINDKVKDQKIDTVLGIAKETLSKIDEHAKTFKLHDEKEMKKYDSNDKHIVELTNTMNNVSKDLNSITSTLSEHKKAIEANKLENDATLKTVVEKQNKFLGGIAVLLVCAGLITGLISYINTQEKESYEKDRAASIKEAALQDKIRALEINSARQYEVLEASKVKRK